MKLPVFAATAVLIALAVSAAANSVGGGELDPTFGSGGTVASNFGGAHESASGVALQSDGKIVVAGYNRVASTWIVARYDAGGGLDPTFGSGGVVKTEFPGVAGAGATAVAVQPDGKIVAAGFAGAGLLARYNSDGSLDSSFDGDGRALIPDEPCSATSLTGETGVALALAANGALVIASGRICYSFPENVYRNVDVVVARFTPDGSPDASFGGDGKVVTDIGGQEAAQAVVVQPDGKPVIAGWRVSDLARPGTDPAQDFLVARYNADGGLDPSFGTNGRVLTDVGGSTKDRAYGITLQADGKVVASGRTCCSPPALALVRYDADGSLDTSFGGDGKVVTEATATGQVPPQASADAIDARGRIVAAGRMNGGATVDFAVVRYLPDGRVDTRFGSGGRVLTDFASADDEAAALAIGSDGRLVVAGQTGPDVIGGDFALARYTASYCLVPRVTGKTLRQARRAIGAGDCAVGTVRRKRSKRAKRGRVISQKPRVGAHLAEGGKVNLVVSSGK